MSFTGLNPQEKQILLNLARSALDTFLNSREKPHITIGDYPQKLRCKAACFVTLKKADGELRGCIGSLEAHQPLVQDIVDNAIASATRDHRFMPVEPEELATLKIEVSVLTPMDEIQFDGDEDLLNQLTPGTDGILLCEGSRRATFLPKVWEKLPNKKEFIEHLRMKAGLDPNASCRHCRVYRYHAIDFGD